MPDQSRFRIKPSLIFPTQREVLSSMFHRADYACQPCSMRKTACFPVSVVTGILRACYTAQTSPAKPVKREKPLASPRLKEFPSNLPYRKHTPDQSRFRMKPSLIFPHSKRGSFKRVSVRRLCLPILFYEKDRLLTCFLDYGIP